MVHVVFMDDKPWYVLMTVAIKSHHSRAHFTFLHKLAQRYNERSKEISIHTEILEELSLWLEYGTLLYVRLSAADYAMQKSNFILVSVDDIRSVTSCTVAV